MKWVRKNLITSLLVVLLILLFITRKQPIIGETKEIVSERIVEVEVRDTIRIITTKEISAPVVKYIVEDNDSIKVNEYKQQLKSNNAVADLTISTTGELKSIFGTITTTDIIKHITVEREIYLRDNKLFLGAELNNNYFQNIDLSLAIDYSIKDKWLIGMSYSPFTKSLSAKLSFKVF